MPFDFMSIINELTRRNKLGGLMTGQVNPMMGHQVFDQSQRLPNQYRTPTNYDQAPQQDHTFADLLKSQIAGYPGEEQHGRMKNLGAALVAGLSAFSGDRTNKNAEMFLHGGEERKLRDWQNKTAMVEKGADDERTANSQIMNQWLADKRLQEQSNYNRSRDENADLTRDRLIKKDEDTNELNKRKVAVSEKLNEIREFNARNKGYIHKTDENGELVVYNPVTKETAKTGIKTNELSDLQKLEFGLNRSLTEIAAKDKNEKENITLRGDETRKTVDERGKVTQDTNKAKVDYNILKGVNVGGKSESESQKAARITNNARELISRRPELADHIEFDASNRFVKINPTKKSSGMFGLGGSSKQLSPQEIKEIGDQIFGRSKNESPADNKKNDPLGIRK